MIKELIIRLASVNEDFKISIKMNSILILNLKNKVNYTLSLIKKYAPIPYRMNNTNRIFAVDIFSVTRLKHTGSCLAGLKTLLYDVIH
jgi:hypothetical protein